MLIKKHFLPIILVICLVATILIATELITKKPINQGVYDPAGTFNSQKSIQIQHTFLAWTPENYQILDKFLADSKNREREVLLTLEPWPFPYSEEKKQSLFADIIQGSYDEVINSYCTALAQYPYQTYIRWGHEMELNLNQYPWQQNNPEEYKKTFTYFVTKCKQTNSKLKIVWSPAGEKTAPLYYPGDKTVDIIGLSVFGFPQWELKHHNKKLHFADIVGTKYHNISQLNKPVMIAELGVTGDESYKKQWLEDARDHFKLFPRLQYVLYFNDINSGDTWGKEFGTPDWRISNTTGQIIFPQKS